MLSGAGFGAIEFATVDEPPLIGRDEGDVLDYERTSPSASEVLAGLSPAQAAELTTQVRDRLVEYESPRWHDHARCRVASHGASCTSRPFR